MEHIFQPLTHIHYPSLSLIHRCSWRVFPRSGDCMIPISTCSWTLGILVRIRLQWEEAYVHCLLSEQTMGTCFSFLVDASNINTTWWLAGSWNWWIISYEHSTQKFDTLAVWQQCPIHGEHIWVRCEPNGVKCIMGPGQNKIATFFSKLRQLQLRAGGHQLIAARMMVWYFLLFNYPPGIKHGNRKWLI